MNRIIYTKKFKQNKYINALEEKLEGKTEDDQLEILYNTVAKDLTCVAIECDKSLLHPHSIVQDDVLDYAHWIQYYLLKLKFIYQESTFAHTSETDFKPSMNKSGAVGHQLSTINSLEETIKSITKWGEFYEDAKKGHSINLIATINMIFLPLAVIVGWFGMNFKSMGAPSLNNGIFTVKYGQTFVFVLFIVFIIITLNFVSSNFNLSV